MSIGRLVHEFRPLFRLLEEPLTRGTPTFYGFPRHPFFPDPFVAPPSTIHPALDLTDEGNNYIVEAELPGVKKENIDITIGDGGRSVTIQGRGTRRRTSESSEFTGETSTSQDQGGDVGSETAPNQLATERVYSGGSSFTRTVWLPGPIDSSKITAKLEDGVLTLKAPKSEDKENVKIHVD